MASNPLFIIPDFFFHFPNELCYGYLRETKLRQPTGQTFSLPSQKNFPISFKPKVAIAKFIWKMKKKIWYYEKWVGGHASFPPRQSVKEIIVLSLNKRVKKYHFFNFFLRLYQEGGTILWDLVSSQIRQKTAKLTLQSR